MIALLRPLPPLALWLLVLTSPAAAQEPERRVEPVRFAHYSVLLPASQGWELAWRANEEEAISLRLLVGQGDSQFRQAQLTVARRGTFDPLLRGKSPAEVFATLASAETAAAQADTEQNEDAQWLGAARDTLTDPDSGHFFHRLWYGLSLGAVRADAYILFWFPPSFADDGFYVRASLEYWSGANMQDPLVLEEFKRVLSSLRLNQRELDVRIIADGTVAESAPQEPLPIAYYDARARVLDSRLDATRKPCWTQVADSVAIALQPTEVPGVVFFSYSDRPREQHDIGNQRFGKGFDRNGDGRFDLVFVNEGFAIDQQDRRFRIFYVVADDDADGVVDGIIYEDGDTNGDGKVDHALYAQDRARSGEPDRAWAFTEDATRPVRPSVHDDFGNFQISRTSRPGEKSANLTEEFHQWAVTLGQLNQALAACPGQFAAATRTP